METAGHGVVVVWRQSLGQNGGKSSPNLRTGATHIGYEAGGTT